MDEGSLSGLILALTIIIAHALVTIGYSALINIRIGEIKDFAEEGKKNARLALNTISNASQISTSYRLISIILLFSLVVVLVSTFSPLENQLLMVVILAFTAMFTIVVGFIVPDAMGAAYSTSITLAFIRPIRWGIAVLSPVNRVIILISAGISSLVGSAEMVNRVTEEEIMTLVDAGHTGGTIEEEEKDMIYSVLQLDQTMASEVMVPRIDVIACEINTPLEEARAIFIESGKSRIPVYKDNIDNIRGMLYAKDLLTYWHNGNRDKIRGIPDLMRSPYFVPDDKPADELLKELQSRRTHIAVVADEYGGTAGIVTIEDIIEEIIGDIQDEYDLEEEEYVQVDENSYRVDASIDLDDFNDLLDLNISTDDNDTLGGFIYTYFGRVPIVGEVVRYENKLLISIESVDGRRIRKVFCTRLHEEEESDEVVQIDTVNDNEITPVDSNPDGT